MSLIIDFRFKVVLRVKGDLAGFPRFIEIYLKGFDRHLFKAPTFVRVINHDHRARH